MTESKTALFDEGIPCLKGVAEGEMRRVSPSKRPGFSLLEIMVVITIVGILSGITATSFNSFNSQSRLDYQIKTMGDALLETRSNALTQKKCADGSIAKIWSVEINKNGFIKLTCENNVGSILSENISACEFRDIESDKSCNITRGAEIEGIKTSNSKIETIGSYDTGTDAIEISYFTDSLRTRLFQKNHPIFSRKNFATVVLRHPVKQNLVDTICIDKVGGHPRITIGEKKCKYRDS